MINKLKRFFKKKKVVFSVLMVLVCLYLYNQYIGLHHKFIEHFVILYVNVKKINNGLDSILACDKSGKCVGKTGLITDFISFKKKLGYPNFSVVLFNDLLTKRKEKDAALSREEIVILVKKGKYVGSFKKDKKEFFESGENDQLPPELEAIDPNSDAGQCVQSLKQVQSLVKSEQDKMEKAYQDDLAKWEASKNSATESFKKSHSLWGKYCKDKDDCTPIGEYFHIYKGGVDGYAGEKLSNKTFKQCMAECRSREWCDWAECDGSNCWLGKGKNNASYDLIYKTGSSMRRVQGRDMSGNKVSDSNVSNINECINKCKYEPKCDVAVYKNSDKKCWLKHMREHDHDMAVKKQVAGNITFPDRH